MHNKLFASVCISLLTLSSLMITANATTSKQNILNSKDIGYINDFGINLYKSVYSNKENIFISPISVYLTLGMVSNGASGDTQKQLLNSMYPKTTLSNFNVVNKNLQSYVVSDRSDALIKIANSIWIRNNFFNSVNKNFLDLNTIYYNAKIYSLDFSSKSASDTVNKWVSESTKDLIKKAIDGQISIDAMMYLINAVYFKADWLNQFNKNETLKSDFTTPQGKVKVDMMNNKKIFSYFENNLFQMISLPYKDNKTSMLIVLPKSDMTTVKNNFTSKNFDQWLKSMESTEVILSLPKVNAEYKKGLKTALSSLGISDLFNSNKADLKNISSEDLYATDLTHNTVFKIDELGTEAASISSIEISLTSLPLDPPKVMNVNKPFLSIIYDNSTGLIIFEGSITNPQ